MKKLLIGGLLTMASVSVFAADVCEGYGPQTGRDIDSREGTNKVVFSMAPPASQMNLCNIHFHKNAEHKAKDFSVPATEGKGFMCGMSQNLTAAELKAPSGKVCGDLKPGDTIEMHWVHTSCDVAPGPGLGSCLSPQCANPNLRVETQVFTLVNDSNAMDFNDMDYDGNMVNGYHQAKSIPMTTGAPVEFLGSTTGPSFDDAMKCSPLQVSWSVRPHCAKVDINTIAKWCESNEFDEKEGHGVRQLVTDPRMLSAIH